MTQEISVTKTEDHYEMQFDGGSAYPVPTSAIDKLDDDLVPEETGDSVSFVGEYGGHKHMKNFDVEEVLEAPGDDEADETDDESSNDENRAEPTNEHVKDDGYQKAAGQAQQIEAQRAFNSKPPEEDNGRLMTDGGQPADEAEPTFDELTELLESGLSPAEAIDYYAVEERGRTQSEWSEARGCSQQSVSKNVNQAKEILSDPRNRINTVRVPVDDLIEALRFNNQPPEYTNRRAAVLRVTPPFESTTDASIYYSEEGNYYPPDLSQEPIHINPRVFVKDRDDTRLPNRNDERARAKEMLDDPTEDEIDEFVTEAFDLWEEFTRKALKSETDINDSEHQYREKHVVSVEYLEDE
ncbi:hypothetical protein [Natronorubrum daqingense]|uniref:DUF8009 domain-containing protein n=1 Tax=Natronorubrum daqingense TaxID=588898 RepID=A0A1N7G5H4_9EURY|nr:hypothetical protein [Natronorubrum daqingense]APX98724.1 hypothetical protein BB347_18640 [Natronorubrum daqingense]SIS07676.1 hypothetical protein SAMN05421809_3731 [Natronorubrum daqingense]